MNYINDELKIFMNIGYNNVLICYIVAAFSLILMKSEVKPFLFPFYIINLFQKRKNQLHLNKKNYYPCFIT